MNKKGTKIVEKPKFKEEDLGINPYISGLEIKVRKLEYKDRYYKNGIKIPDFVKDVEYENYCKLYVDSTRRLHIADMSARAKELYLWLLYEVKPGDGHVWINKIRYMKEVDITAPNTYRNAVNELVTVGILGISVIRKEVYFINPYFFFNGDRVEKYKDNLIQVYERV